MPTVGHRAMMRRLATGGALVGVGLGALLDGILFHDILQWHHYVDARTPDLGANLLADGVFAALGWLALVVGLALVWRARHALSPQAGRRLAGWMLAGAALLNAFDVLVQHFMLRLHWLHPSGDVRYDLAFLALNLAVAAVGLRIARAGRAPAPARRAATRASR